MAAKRTASFFGHRRLRSAIAVEGELGGYEVPIGRDELLPIDALVLRIGGLDVLAEELVELGRFLALSAQDGLVEGGVGEPGRGRLGLDPLHLGEALAA